MNYTPWNKALASKDVEATKANLEEAKKGVGGLKEPQKTHVESFIARAEVFLGIKEDSADVDTRPLDLVVGEKWVNLRKSALRRGKDFNLTFSDVKRLLSRKKCAYTGVSFEPTGDNQRTIDRIDHTKGYVKGNVVPVTDLSNRVKNSLFEEHSGCDLTFSEVVKMIKVLEKAKFRCTIETNS